MVGGIFNQSDHEGEPMRKAKPFEGNIEHGTLPSVIYWMLSWKRYNDCSEHERADPEAKQKLRYLIRSL